MQLAQTAGIYPPPAPAVNQPRWGNIQGWGNAVPSPTPWVNAVFPFNREPALGEEWEPGVVSVEFAFSAAPGADLVIVLYQNPAVIPGSPNDPGGVPLARIVLPNQANPDVVVQNVAQPMGNLKSGDRLALVITQPANPAWTLNFKASVQGTAKRPSPRARRILV